MSCIFGVVHGVRFTNPFFCGHLTVRKELLSDFSKVVSSIVLVRWILNYFCEPIQLCVVVLMFRTLFLNAGQEQYLFFQMFSSQIINLYIWILDSRFGVLKKDIHMILYLLNRNLQWILFPISMRWDCIVASL